MNSVYVINNDNTNYKDDEYKILKWSERERESVERENWWDKRLTTHIVVLFYSIPTA